MWAAASGSGGGLVAQHLGLTGWPDYIVCYSTGAARWEVYALAINAPAGNWIQYMGLGNSVYRQFDNAGNYTGEWGLGTDCFGLSIAQLKSAGRAW